ncbi:MAG: putative Ig domain-containing protein, partial [Spirochaetota bacterium]
LLVYNCKKEKDNAILLCFGLLTLINQQKSATSDTNTATSTSTTTDSAPSSLTYSGSPYTFTIGTAITAQTPTVIGTITACSVNPSLPAGLSIDSTNCAIRGTPTTTQTASNYTITASNSFGSTTTTITITANGWKQEAYLKAANANASDLFGHSIAIASDTIVVGAIGEASNQTTITNGTTASTDNSASSSGAVYVFKRSGNTWAQEAYLKAPNANANDQFGVSVAIDSDTIVVGADQEDSNQTTITNGATASADNSTKDFGAAYVYKRSGSTWTQEAYLKAANAEADDLFGNSVAIASDTIVVGARLEDSNQTTITNGSTASTNNSTMNAGAVYVFQRSGSTWIQEAYLKAPNPNTLAVFGVSISIASDTIAVGALGEPSNQTTITNGTTASADNSAFVSGAVYIFKRSGSTWAQEAYLKAPNAEASDQFGHSISIASDTLAVLATGEASNQTTITNGTTASTDNSASSAGAVYVFKRSGNTWAQEAYIKTPNAETNDSLQTTFTLNRLLSISSDTIVLGVNGEDSNQTTITHGTTANADNSVSSAGAAYVFKRNGNTWAQEAYLKATNAEVDDQFGSSVSIASDTIAVGAIGEDSNQTTITNGTTASTDNSASNSGAVYVFRRK